MLASTIPRAEHLGAADKRRARAPIKLTPERPFAYGKAGEVSCRVQRHQKFKSQEAKYLLCQAVSTARLLRFFFMESNQGIDLTLTVLLTVYLI